MLSGVLLFSVYVVAVLLGEINLLSSFYLWVSAQIFLPLDCKCSYFSDNTSVPWAWVYTHHIPFSIADWFLMSCFMSLTCLVLCLVVLKVSIMTLTSLVSWYTLLHQVAVPSRFLCQFLLFFFSMSLWACLPLAFCFIPEAARPDNTYVCPLVDLDVDLFPDDNEGVQAICDNWGVTQEALMVNFLF